MERLKLRRGNPRDLATHGSGSGSGDGSGDGSGYGSGYGSGDGSGYGDGYGYGSGDGSGYGSGYGDGDGYWLAAIDSVSESWPKAQAERLATLRKSKGVTVAIWRSDPNGMPANGGRSNQAARAGLIESTTETVVLCQRGFHATLEPAKWKGDRWWVVALSGEVQGNEEKYVGRTREIIGELTFTRALAHS